MADPFSGFLQGLLTSREYQMQKARQIADQTFRDAQLQIDRDTLKQRQAEEIANAKQRDFQNDFATRKQDSEETFDLMKMAEGQYQFNANQERYDADRKSREAIAKQRSDAQMEVAKNRNLSQEDRLFLTNALRYADTPEGVAQLVDWMRGHLSGNPPAAPSGAPASPMAPPAVQMAPTPANPLLQMLNMGGASASPLASPPAGGFDPGQPFGGSAGAQIQSRNAYAEKMRMEVAHKQQEYALEDAKALASLEGQKLRNERMKTLTPIERELRKAQIKNVESQISTRSQEISLRERNAQWEHKYKEASADEKRRLAGGSIDTLRGKMQSAAGAMRSTEKERDAILLEADRIMADIRAGQDFSDIKGGQIGGPERGSYYYRLLKKASELESVVRGAKANYYHYQKILEETGNLTYVDEKPKPPAIASPTRAGAKGLAKVTPPPGARPNRYQPTAEETARKARAGTRFVKPGSKPETDAEIMARLRRKYGN